MIDNEFSGKVETMNLEELKSLAEAAPEGPWFGPEYAPGTSYVFDVDLGSLLHYESIDTEQDACLRYVAAANPAAVLALIAENERLRYAVELRNKNMAMLRGDVESKDNRIRNHFETIDSLAGERNQVTAERDSLRQQLDALELSRRSWMDEAKSLEERLAEFVDRKPVLWFKHLKGSECKSDGRTYDVMFCKMDGYQPLYDSPPALASPVDLSSSLESLAKQIYQSWESQPGFQPWIEGGNSAKQEEARQIASRTFELALANQVGGES